MSKVDFEKKKFRKKKKKIQKKKISWKKSVKKSEIFEIKNSKFFFSKFTFDIFIRFSILLLSKTSSKNWNFKIQYDAFLHASHSASTRIEII